MKTTLAVLISLATFSTATPAWSDSEAITIGVSLGLTGKYAKMGDMQRKAYRIWEAQKNAEGGILGKRVEIIIQDDHSDKAEVARIYEGYINGSRVDFVIGPYSSPLTEVAARIAERNRVPMLAAGAAADRIWQNGYQYIFGMWTPASRYVLGFLEMLIAYGINNIAIITADDSFALSIANGTRDWAKRLDINVNHFEVFKKGTRDLTPQVQRAKSKGTDVLITTGHYNEASDAHAALKALHWRPKLFLATVGPTFSKYYDDHKADAEGVCSVSIWEPHPRLKFPGSQKFADEFKRLYGVPPTYHAATAFAAGELLGQAIEKAGNLDGERIRSVLAAMNTYSIIGRYAVDRTGLQVKRFPLCIQWQKGKKEIIWPEELRTAEPVFWDSK